METSPTETLYDLVFFNLSDFRGRPSRFLAGCRSIPPTLRSTQSTDLLKRSKGSDRGLIVVAHCTVPRKGLIRPFKSRSL